MNLVLQDWVPVLYRLSLVCTKLSRDKIKKEVATASARLLDQVKSLDLRFNLEIEKAAQKVPERPVLKIPQPEVRSLTLYEARRLPGEYGRFAEEMDHFQICCFLKDQTQAPFVYLDKGKYWLALPKRLYKLEEK